MLKVRLRVLSFFIFLFFFLFSCSSQQAQTYDLKFNTRLLDGKKVKIVFRVSCDKKSSIIELNKEVKKIKYALSIVFSKITSKEIQSKKSESTKNSLFRILEKNFKIKPQKIEIIKLTLY